MLFGGAITGEQQLRAVVPSRDLPQRVEQEIDVLLLGQSADEEQAMVRRIKSV